MRLRFWAPDETTVRTVVRGPNPLTVAGNRAIDLSSGRALSGRTAPVFGDPSDPAFNFLGYGPTLQDFRGGSLVTARRAPVRGDNQALPGTTTPVGATNDVLELLRRARR